MGPAAEPLDERNWYLPGWLQWLPYLDVEGHAEPARAVKPAPRFARPTEPSFAQKSCTPAGREADDEPDLGSQRDIGGHGDHDSQRHADHGADNQKHPERAALAVRAAGHRSILRKQDAVVNAVG